MSNVIEIGDFSVERQRRWSVESAKECQHKRLTLEKIGDVVRCRDCETQVGAFWALGMLLDGFSRWSERIKYDARQLAEEKRKGVHLLAARAAEKAWRSKGRVPTCPHCSEAIFPEDRFGSSFVHKQIALARRAARGKKGFTNDPLSDLR